MFPQRSKPYYLGERAALYDETLGRLRDYGAQAEFINAQIEKRLAEKSELSLLELGCGTGLILRHVADKLRLPCRFLGVDVSPDMLRIARKRCDDGRFEFAEANALDFLQHTDKTFDCILLLFNFLQGFSNVREAASVLSAAIGRLTRGGVLIFDWHNEPAYGSAFRPGAWTRLNLVQPETRGRTNCFIRADSFDGRKELRCYFSIVSAGRPYAKLTTRHLLLPFDQQTVSGILDFAGGRAMEASGEFSGTPFNASSDTRCISVVSRVGFAEHVRQVSSRRLRIAGFSNSRLCLVGSAATAWSKPIGGDIDLLIIVPDEAFAKPSDLARIFEVMKSVSSQFGLSQPEFRQGPFKTTRGVGLHVLVHTPRSLSGIPLIIRRAWFTNPDSSDELTEFCDASADHESLLQSFRSELRALYRQFLKSEVEFREWTFSPEPRLCSHRFPLAFTEHRDTAYRYFVRAGISAVSALRGVTSEDQLAWFSANAGPEIKSLARRLAENHRNQISCDEMRAFFKHLLKISCPTSPSNATQTCSGLHAVGRVQLPAGVPEHFPPPAALTAGHRSSCPR